MNEGEWTGDDDGVLLPMHRFVGQYAKEIAGAHNAELAAAYGKGEWTDLYVLELLGNPKNQGWSLHPDRIKSLIDAHNAALAAAIDEATKPLVDALTKIALQPNSCSCCLIADAALAKAGKQ